MGFFLSLFLSLGRELVYKNQMRIIWDNKMDDRGLVDEIVTRSGALKQVWDNRIGPWALRCVCVALRCAEVRLVCAGRLKGSGGCCRGPCLVSFLPFDTRSTERERKKRCIAQLMMVSVRRGGVGPRLEREAPEQERQDGDRLLSIECVEL